jgi:D-arabinose 1-dehydrogenase-like Zn-dependent alcohol dehydrogenase
MTAARVVALDVSEEKPALARHTETYALDEAPLAYERLHAGKVNGRAVILHG